MMCGKWALSSSLEPGVRAYLPDAWREPGCLETGNNCDAGPVRVGEGNAAFGLTKYALNYRNQQEIHENVWDD